MFAVIKTGGKQYRVAADDLLEIEKLDAAAGDAVVFEDVLMVGDEDGLTIGTPLVQGASVVAELVEQKRAGKIIVFKKKRRQNYRRKAGHRQHLSVVRITDILTAGAKSKARPSQKKAATPAKADSATPAKADSAAPAVGGDLKKITGVGPALEKKLHGLGVTSLEQIADFSAEDIERVDTALNFKGRIERDDWIGQAKKFLADKQKSGD